MTQEYLKQNFYYRDGVFFFRHGDKKGRCYVGGRYSHGYRNISIGRKKFYYHRAVFLFHHGFLPRIVDHVNGVVGDNRIANLRAASDSESVCNRRKMKKKTSSKYMGVSFHKRAKKFMVEVRFRNKRHYVGLFISELEAAAARDEAAKRIQGKFAKLNF